MNFYAEFLAAVDVYHDYPQHFGELVLDAPGSFGPRQPAVVRASAERPASSSSASASASSSTRSSYRVRRGDTLWNIARRFEVGMRELMERNGLKGSSIYAGQILILP
jgi:membrane-bound lytic murein transglycosylase D